MEERITVQRANVVLDIDPAEKADYMAKGFSVVNKFTGQVIEEVLPIDPNALQIKVKELTEQLEKANNTIAELNKTILELKNGSVEKTEKPTRGRRSKE